MAIVLNFKKVLFANFILAVLLLTPLSGNWAWLHITASAIFILLNGWILGSKIFKTLSYAGQQILGFLLLSLIFAIIGTAGFYFYSLRDYLWQAGSSVIALLFPFFAFKHPLLIEWAKPRLRLNFWLLILIPLYLFLVFIAFLLVINSGTVESIRSPWEVIPGQIFLLYFLATLVLFFIAQLAATAWPMLLIVLHFFLTLSLAIFVFEIGFGYDPFIHRANLNLIAANGTLLPKPFYYIGQYSLILFYNFLFKIPLDWLDKFLVPVLTAIYLPLTAYWSFKNNFKTKNNVLLLTVLAILAFPLYGYIATTPQALANLLSLLTVLICLFYLHQQKTNFWPLLILVTANLCVHPLAGLPMAFFAALTIFYQYWRFKFNLPSLLRHSIIWEIAILGSIALPFAFLLNSLTMSEMKVALQTGWFGNLISGFGDFNFTLYWRRFISLPDLLYTYNLNLAWLIAVLVAAGIIFITRHGQLKRYFVFVVGALMIFINYLLLKAMLHFFSLISYEQQNYPKRVLELSLYILAPFILTALYLLFQKLVKNKALIQISAFILLATAVTASFYYVYPRVDKIKESHGYSTSAVDLKTVLFIEKLQNLSNDQPYIVLASQPLSAGAIKELGFKYYYNNYFFYPVPTGGRLYQLYEDLAYGKKPTAEVIATVRWLTGVKTVYLVINDYWFNAEPKIEAEKEIAQQWFAIDGKNYIFRY